MIGASAFAVFALGLRHGADPDHLAAIDNLTRNSATRQPRLSRFTGTLFACGHAIMVLAIACLAGYAGARLGAHHEAIETIGTWTSIAVLVTLAALNLAALRSPSCRVAGLRSRLLPRVLRQGTHVWLAIPAGVLFGIGFETSSQVAAYTIAFGSQAGVAGAVFIGAAFCLGMACTDTLDSLLVHRLIAYRGDALPRLMRLWVLTIALLALAVAAFELASAIGRPLPVPDAALSAGIVAVLLAAFTRVYASRNV